MKSRRILITGISTYFGSRLAQALEADESIEAIVGVDRTDPVRELERTEFVRLGTQHSLIRRIVKAAAIDTVIDTRLIVDSLVAPARQAHENNVIGTLNILAACSGDDSPVRKLVFKSSAHYYGCEQDDPAFFTEAMRRPHRPATALERSIVEAEAAVDEFAARHPDRLVTVLRFANALGPDISTSFTRLFSLPVVVPSIVGFDPRLQFIHEDDVVGALEHAARGELPGIYNAAADGVLVLSEIASLLGKRYLPSISPWGTRMAAAALSRTGLRIPVEMLNQLRFGRGLDNRRLKAAGFRYGATTRETVVKLREHLRLAPILAGMQEPYRYEREVEEFLRWSPSVVEVAERRGGPGAGRPSARQIAELRRALAGLAGAAEAPSPAAPAPPVAEYDDLAAEEVVAALPGLGQEDLEALREHEAANRARTDVMRAIDASLARRAQAAP